MLDALELDLAGKTVTTDALLTQRTLAQCLRQRVAHFVFTVKANQPTVLADVPPSARVPRHAPGSPDALVRQPGS